MEEAPYFIMDESTILASYVEDEYIFRMFTSSGEEIALPNMDSTTGMRIEDYNADDISTQYPVAFDGQADEYTLLVAKNTNKESQVVEALHKSLPILCIVVFVASLIAAFFYTWYMTRPIKQVSRISKRMANMDFSGLCSTERTDEVGVLSQSLNDLSGRLSSALSGLQSANQKLQEDIDKERELERQRVEFFSAASHELKTPITIIKGQLQGMLCKVGRYKDRETYLAQSLEVTNTLEQMVQELLTISRLDAPGYACKKARLDFTGLVNDRIRAHEDLFVQRELTLKESLAPEIYLDGDPQLLQKALDNVIGNAILYSPIGSEVFIKLFAEKGRVYLNIENTNASIPNESISKLFEPFYRVEQSRSRETGGSGLGLYLTKMILDLHEADIQIANSARGVIVTMRF